MSQLFNTALNEKMPWAESGAAAVELLRVFPPASPGLFLQSIAFSDDALGLKVWPDLICDAAPLLSRIPTPPCSVW
jgi:hypothetical protein